MEASKTKSPPEVVSGDMFSAVRPTGWLWERLKNISNPRKHRWNAYLRACRRIPQESPLHGTTSWNKINERRHHLIVEEIAAHKKTGLPWKDKKRSPELAALQAVAGQVVAGGLVAQNFLMARALRRLKRALKAENLEVCDCRGKTQPTDTDAK